MSWRKEQSGEVPRTVRTELADRIFQFFNQTHNLEISPQSAQHLYEANQHLAEGPLVVYINHVSMTDAKLMVPLILSLPNVQRVIGPVGMKHYDLRRDLINGIFMRSLRIAGVHALPVIQSIDDHFYREDQKIGMMKKLKKETKTILSQPGSLYGIAPEGTRNKDGTLRRANPGLGYLRGYVDPVVPLRYLPVGLVYKQFDPQPRLEVGTTLRVEDLISDETELPKKPRDQAQHISDLLMYRLAELLPPQMRGKYSNPELAF